MTVSPVSLSNWKQIVFPELSERQNDFYNIVLEYRDRGITCYEVAEVMTKRYGYPVFPNHISGRMTELFAMDYIIIDRWKKVGKRNHSVLVPKVDVNGQIKLL
jgi:hypothetical protein